MILPVKFEENTSILKANFGEIYEVSPEENPELKKLALLSDGGGVENPETTDYLNDLTAQKTALAETLQEVGVEASTEETFSTLVPKCNEKIRELAVSADLINVITNNGKRGEYIFYKCSDATELPPISLPEATSIIGAFNGCSSLGKIEVDAPNAMILANAFLNCSSATEIVLNNTAKPTEVQGAFKNCSSATKLPAVNAEAVSAAQRSAELYYGCSAMTELPEMDYSKVKYMRSWFGRCVSLPKYLTIDISSCIDAQSMFANVPFEELTITVSEVCTSLTSLCAGGDGTNPMGTKQLTIIGDTSNANFSNIFFKSQAISLLGDNLVFGKNSNCGSMWMYWCTNFQNITPKRIEANFYMAHTGKLTLESAKNIINALVDYSGTDEEFTYTVTFSATTLALLEAEGATAPDGMTWLEYADSKKWNT